mgnify:CR=1 FL=1
MIRLRKVLFRSLDIEAPRPRILYNSGKANVTSLRILPHSPRSNTKIIHNISILNHEWNFTTLFKFHQTALDLAQLNNYLKIVELLSHANQY